MTQIIVSAVLMVVALSVAWFVQRRTITDAPTQPAWQAPVQLDRSEFVRPEAPWLVAVFSSATCSTCSKVVSQAQVLESHDVAVEVVEYGAQRDRHDRYHIEAVPIVAIADANGVVQRSFVGPHSATDLWAALAGLRGEPPTAIDSCHREQ